MDKRIIKCATLPLLTYHTNTVMKVTYLFFCMVMFVACHKRYEKKPGEISTIELATGDCFGPCQLTAIKLDTSLNCQFYGGWAPSFNQQKIIKGYYSGKITVAIWDSITKHLQQIKFKKLEHHFPEVNDAQPLEVIIHYANTVTHIWATFSGLPEKVREVCNEIANTYKNVDLKKVKQSIKFETTYQQRWRLQVSDSVGLAKKLKTFLCEYNINGQKINGHPVQSLFAEKEHTINDFGVCDTLGYRWHFVLIFKPLLNDTIFKLYNSNWEMSLGEFNMEQKNKGMFYGFTTDVYPPDKFSIVFIKNIHQANPEDDLILMQSIKNAKVNNNKKLPTKTVVTFYKIK